MVIAVIGPGAVGLGIGSCLLAAGERTLFVTRPGAAQAEALRRGGLHRSGLFGELRFGAGEFAVTDRLETLAEQPVDFALVCTKTFDAPAVAEALGALWPRLPGEPRVVLLYNGWGSGDLFAARLPHERLYAGRVITGFRRRAPNAVEITVHADAIRIGSLWGADPGPLPELCRSIAKGGIPCEPSPSIGRDLWSKMLYNCALNPLGALLQVPYGALGERPTTRAIMAEIVRELFEVMGACGFEAHWSSPEAYLADFYAELLPPTAEHESSMLQDLRAGRRTEIDALCGAVEELGARAKVPTPVNAALRALILAIESR